MSSPEFARGPPLWRASAFMETACDRLRVGASGHAATSRRVAPRPNLWSVVQFLRGSRRLRFHLAALVSGIPAVLRCCCRVLIIGAAFDSGKLGQRSIGWPFFPLGSDNRASHRSKACLISAGALFLGDAFENLDCDGRDKQMVLPSRRMVSALSQEPFAAVVAERLDVAHVGSQHFEAFVSAMIGGRPTRPRW
jgi:hypothetical protein